MNQLKNAHSPYLLQHAENPVHWKFWNNKTLENALKENKLLLISIGYSACHWCHVMEHECFEDFEVAEVMNTDFISIKIDREEQPEVDAIYMKALQLMTKQGGWPLNIVALPNGKPVWGATYVNKNEWINVLSQLADLYKNDPEKMIDYADKLLNGIEIMSDTNELPKSKTSFDLDELVNKWKRSFDLEFGGYSRAPKFMMPTNLDFLQTFGFLKKDNAILDYVDLTLTRMAWGGLFDTVHGGFSRYSVDVKWHIPHFEKMLYDNALLLKTYSDAYKRTNKPLYKEVITKTIQFLNNEFYNAQGGFYSAFDADSLTKENKLVEGAFYSWRIEELKNIISDDFDLFSKVFNINSFGFWEEDLYVLIQNEELELIAKEANIPLEELVEKKRIWEIQLKQIRDKRQKPRLDDKIITSWNAMLLSGLVHANSILNDIALENTITSLETFISNQLTKEDYHLGHVYKNNQLYIDGLFEDYAFVIQAYIDLYSSTFDESYLQKAKNYTHVAFDLFYDVEKQFFCSHKNDPNLIIKHFEIEDNVVPASNSVMANNLIVLGLLFENSYFTETAKKMTNHILETIDYASAFSHWLLAFLKTEKSFTEITIIGDKANEYNNEINNFFIPNSIISGSKCKSNVPFLKDYSFNQTTDIYICTNKNCLKPINSIEEFSIYYENINN
ncbi:thioredoxin domain-containing protein [Paenimyroides tangerinum]|uniref:Thioredoxin domain-containing protein n=1 Tax=Paenimyroides tangerinum TaxID=2488728 RepID=A0A3P3WB64_9FLAO|nr:thioredoxin domain-containing protein [Paenimyroides tangerinum]RRJ90849.1 thioredoxin domain-containing protein [Paenimyroides tangerinum]